MSEKMKTIKDLFHIGIAIGALALAYQLGCSALDKTVIGYKVDNQYGITKDESDRCRLRCIDGKAYLNKKEVSCEDLVFRVMWDNNGEKGISDEVNELEPFKCKGLQSRIAVDAYEK